MTEKQLVDHLFRHQYGKMVAILTRFFGLENLETIEDAVQDTFAQATLKWRNQIPEKPEAWLTQAAKNRVIDLLRKIKVDHERFKHISSGSAAIQLNDLFLDHEVQDSQLRMIFVACHPALDAREQIAFALNTVSGFNTREIATALLTKEETIKKRLSRARKSIHEQQLKFDYPAPKEIDQRITRVHEVLYLIFNEGFHSAGTDEVVRRDLCGEAIRLIQLLLAKEQFRSGELYALFALMCFHAARLESKVSNNELIDLRNQDRSLWHWPLISLGNDAMNKAMEYDDLSPYHYEAAIAAEHIKADDFESTDWQKILTFYQKLHEIQPSVSTELSIALVMIQLEDLKHAREALEKIDQDQLASRAYLYYGAYSQLEEKAGHTDKAFEYIEKAIYATTNPQEESYLRSKKKSLIDKTSSRT